MSEEDYLEIDMIAKLIKIHKDPKKYNNNYNMKHYNIKKNISIKINQDIFKVKNKKNLKLKNK